MFTSTSNRRIGKLVHISTPLGTDGRGPFAPINSERQRVIQNIEAISLTGPGERPMRPDLGSILAVLADEPADARTKRLVETTMLSMYKTHEPFVGFTRVETEVQVLGDSVRITLTVLGILKRTGDILNHTFGIEASI